MKRNCDNCDRQKREVFSHMPGGKYRLGFHCPNCETLTVTSDTIERIKKDSEIIYKY